MAYGVWRIEQGGVGVVRAASEHLTGLWFLNLRSNGIGPEGAKAVAQLPNFAGLLEMDIGGRNSIGRQGAEALEASPYMATDILYHGDYFPN
jgi:hypothetical protein